MTTRTSSRNRKPPTRLIEEDNVREQKKAAATSATNKKRKATDVDKVDKEEKKTKNVQVVKQPKKDAKKPQKKRKVDDDSDDEVPDDDDDDEDVEEEEEDDEEEWSSRRRKRLKTPKAATPKKGVLASLSEQQRTELDALSVPELKERLRANDQLLKGNRNDLAERIADCILNGGMPRCPKCFGGKLKIGSGGSYFCPGSYDDDQFVHCNFVSKDVVRAKWKPADGKSI